MTMNFMECLMRNEMTTTDLIKSHEECIKVLEAIEDFEDRINNTRLWIADFGSIFPELIDRNLNRIDTYTRCIERLKLRYDKLKRTL